MIANIDHKPPDKSGDVGELIINRPFDQNQIKKRPGAFGRTLEYVPANEVIKRLNNAGAWNCRIVKEMIDETEVALLVELEIGESKRQQWGGKQRKGVSLADALKAATSDGIKKAATLFGVALDLRDDDDVMPTKPYVQQNQRNV